jgi:26S proteasome regulatory subunit N5
MPTRMDKMNLIQTIWEATEGKFYVEVEYARSTRRLAEMKEEDGLMREAADIILEV